MNKKEFDFWFEDYKYLAEAFAKGDLNWHEKEWKDFIKLIRTETLQAIKDKMPKEKETITVVYYANGLPNPDKSILLKENIGFNEYRSQMLEIIKELNK